MKTIGLLGGMSWESTVSHYQAIDRTVVERLRGLHAAKPLLYSVDFAEIEVLQRAERWTEAGEVLAEASTRFEGAGADLIVVGTNTMHRVWEQIEASVAVPLLHIADPTAEGAEGVVLGCTEIGLQLRPEDVPLPLFDTAQLHAEAAVTLALGGAGDASSRAPSG